MHKVVNAAIQLYCYFLSEKFKIQNSSRLQKIVKKTIIEFDYKKIGSEMGLWDKSPFADILKSSLDVFKYFPPLYLDILRSWGAEYIKLLFDHEKILVDDLRIHFRFN